MNQNSQNRHRWILLLHPTTSLHSDWGGSNSSDRDVALGFARFQFWVDLLFCASQNPFFLNRLYTHERVTIIQLKRKELQLIFGGEVFTKIIHMALVVLFSHVPNSEENMSLHACRCSGLRTRFSTLDFQDFCDFCERYQNYEREASRMGDASCQ